MDFGKDEIAKMGNDYRASIAHNRANAAELELKRFFQSEGLDPIVHVSGSRKSEWYEVSREMVEKAFEHLIDVRSPGILFERKPEPTDAWYFGENVDLDASDVSGSNLLDKYSRWSPIPERDDRQRRDLEKQLRDLEELAKRERI